VSTAEKWPLSGGLFFGEAHVALDCERWHSWRPLPGGQGGIEAEDEAVDEVREERSGLVVLGAVGFEPFMVVVLAKGVQEGEDGRELGSWDRSMVFWL